MSRPPIKALESIKKYCEKTQCRRCAFGHTVDGASHYVDCLLLDATPCDWDIELNLHKEAENEDNKSI